MRIKDERIKALALQLCEKEQQLQPPTEATKEELEHGYKQQLKESRVSYDQLRESSCWCDIKLLREEVNELQGANRVKDEEISTLKIICQLSCCVSLSNHLPWTMAVLICMPNIAEEFV